MVDYKKWDEKDVQVIALQLDPENPRIPPTPAPMEQRELIAELVKHDNVLDLMKDIAEDGYAPIESLIGMRENGKQIVLEGNRRLAALKLLLSPDTAPPEALRQVRSYAETTDTNDIKKVRVIFAPSREAAAKLIMQKHTRNQVEGWGPVMQARFYRKLADGGLSPAEMAKRYGGTPGDVAGFLRLEASYDLACRLDLPEAVRAKVQDPRSFPVTILRRLLEYPKAREALGISYDPDGRVVGKGDAKEFAKGYAKILTDIADKTVDSRTINTAEDTANYLKKIKRDLPDVTKKGTFGAADFNKGSGAAPLTKPTPAPKKSTKPRESATLVPSGTKCQVKSARIKEVFDELRLLKLEKNPNAAAVMFRILLEISLGYYLDKTKNIEPLLAHAKKQGKGADWYPTLRQMLNEVLKDPAFVPDTLARKRIQKLVSDATSPLSVDGLDSYVHNRFSMPSTRDLRSYWETFEALLDLTLQEPAPPGKP